MCGEECWCGKQYSEERGGEELYVYALKNWGDSFVAKATQKSTPSLLMLLAPSLIIISWTKFKSNRIISWTKFKLNGYLNGFMVKWRSRKIIIYGRSIFYLYYSKQIFIQHMIIWRNSILPNTKILINQQFLRYILQMLHQSLCKKVKMLKKQKKYNVQKL